MVNKQLFDLNIEEILENWEVHHAIREIIANALDEQTISKTRNIKISQDQVFNDVWHIRDFGRGLQTKHLTQNENEEKLNNYNLIGKFGIGLKDAFATFYRHNIDVYVQSKYLIITKINSYKKGKFNNIDTLHAVVQRPGPTNFVGTEFILKGVRAKDMVKAKELFLQFADLEILDTTQYGQIIKKDDNGISYIYLNGVRAGEEPNLLFSYNITALDKKIRDALNRERTNVGRSAYSNRIKYILKKSTNKVVLDILVNEFKQLDQGGGADEISWIEVQEHVIKHLNGDDYVFLTRSDLEHYPQWIDSIHSSEKQIIYIPENLASKVEKMKDIYDEPINNIEQFIEEERNSFEFDFVNIDELTRHEKKIFDLTNKIIRLVRFQPFQISEVKISNNIQKGDFSFVIVEGIWIKDTRTIVIKRTALDSLEHYSAVLLHEVIHAKSNASDISREFEAELSKSLGILANKILK